MAAKASVLILHGALGAMDQFSKLEDQLKDRFDVHRLNFSGHGGKTDHDAPFSIDLFSKDTINYIQSNELKPVKVFGYSMGGYVALNVAMNHPDLIEKIFTLGTKFHWTTESASHEIKMLNPDKIKEKVPAFAQALEKRHSPNDWESVMQKTAQMMIDLGNGKALTNEDLKTIETPALVTVGGADTMVSEEETLNAAENLPNAEFRKIPDWQHPIEKVDQVLLAEMTFDFLG